MFSEKTKDLAKQLRYVQEQLNKSIVEDIGLPEGTCHLCIPHKEQIWFDTKEVPTNIIKGMLQPIEDSSPGSVKNTEHLYYKIGGVPFVTVVNIEE